MPMQTRKNRRGRDEHYVNGRHLNLDDLKQEARHLGNQYLYKENIPAYPQPEFHVSHLKHDTNQEGLCGIRTDKGFGVPHNGSEDPHRGILQWWSLAVGPDEVKAAETRLLQQKFSDLTDDQAAMHPSFLYKFTTSPAFSEKSRLGSYRFTFPLEEVLEAYRLQFCSGDQPVMRVYETVLHKQEVQHTVLVHSPANQELFSEYPLLTDDPNAVCVYKDGRFFWRPYAISETHRYELVKRPEMKQMDALQLDGKVFYIWDNVAIALHVDKQVLKFDDGKLRENLRFCHQDEPSVGTFDSFNDAKDQVKLWWPDCDSPLKKECSLEQRFTDLRLVLVGRTGSGKSSSGNIILGTDAFSAGDAAAENAQCCLQMKKVFDWEVTVVDTPGLSEAPEVKTEISDMLAPEPHTFLLVIKVRTRIDEERDTVRQMEEIFGRNVWWHTIVVLTYDDQSETDVQMLNRTKTRLQKILPRSMKDRCYVLNNNRNSSNSQQVFDLLEAVATLVAPTRQQGRSSSYRRRFRLRGGNKSPSPTTLILGDSIIENVRVYQAEIHSIPGATVSMIQNKLQDLLPSLKPSIERVIIHVGAIDILRQQSEVTKADFRLLLRFLQPCGKTVFISGPIPTMKRDEDLFSRTLSLHEWLQSVCREQGLRYIKNFDLFWKRRCFFAKNGFNLNRSGSEKLAANIERAIQSSARG